MSHMHLQFLFFVSCLRASFATFAENYSQKYSPIQAMQLEVQIIYC